jgi:hypothetical protein
LRLCATTAPSQFARLTAAARFNAGGHIEPKLLFGCGLLVIFVPLFLTLYLSFSNEKLILFPSRVTRSRGMHR